MHIRLSKTMFSRLTATELDSIGRTQSNLRGLDNMDVSLIEMSPDQIENFRAALVRLKDAGTRMLNPLIADIDRWNAIMSGDADAGDERPATMKGFADLLTEYLRTAPGHRVYIQSNDREWLAYYTNYVEYKREVRDRNHGFIPAHIEIHLTYWMLGNSYDEEVILYNEDVNGQSVAVALANKGIFAESESLRADYMVAKDRFDAVFEQIGRQYTTKGYGETLNERFSSWRSRVSMMREGVAAKVVIDVLKDSNDRSAGNRGGGVRSNFWNMKRPRAVANKSSEELSLHSRTIFSDTISEPPEIPIHPVVPVYHLALHNRFQVNVMELQEYSYNKELNNLLILPDITKRLIDVLVSQGRVSFQDIVEGKGAGACILLGGPPGVGKTLTAEVFAEATERPLLSVQAAQLGVNPDTIEKQFNRILMLGSRWNAVVLLDEADVYIAKRGTNLNQNAIVATFLRMLENHTATIFMTTNRANDVDDAVLSRCLARITYKKPDKANQRMIWKVMSDLNGINLPECDIEQIVERHGSLSGRDIKQVIKLASLWAANHDEVVSPATVDFVVEFLPTLSDE